MEPGEVVVGTGHTGHEMLEQGREVWAGASLLMGSKAVEQMCNERSDLVW